MRRCYVTFASTTGFSRRIGTIWMPIASLVERVEDASSQAPFAAFRLRVSSFLYIVGETFNNVEFPGHTFE